jgi:hypothetical protein
MDILFGHDRDARVSPSAERSPSRLLLASSGMRWTRKRPTPSIPSLRPSRHLRATSRIPIRFPHRPGGCACPGCNLTFSPTLSTLDFLRHPCLKLQKRVQLLACGCARPGLFTIFDDATASLDTNPDLLSPRNRTDVLFGQHRSAGSFHLARCWVDCITTTTGKQRTMLDKEEVNHKQPVTEAGSRSKAAPVLQSTNSQRSNGNPVSGFSLWQLDG